MATIRTVNLFWERKYRGAYPLARYALDDAGTLTLAVPRPLEARTFDLTRLQPGWRHRNPVEFRGRDPGEAGDGGAGGQRDRHDGGRPLPVSCRDANPAFCRTAVSTMSMRR